MKTLNLKIGVCIFVAVFAFSLCTVSFGQGSESKNSGSKAKESGSAEKKACCIAEAKYKPQTVCPIMGGKIDKKQYADVAGYRIYVCCAGCIDPIKKDPEKAIETLRKKGEMPERHLVVCGKCGELKGTEKCCKVDAEKCSKCNLNKGSVGCCKDLKPAEGEKDIVLCAKCGEVKGTEVCCNKEAVKCSKCGMAKGSPGCCKIKPACCEAAEKK